MALVKHNALVEDPFFDATAADSELPAQGPVIVSLERWQRERDVLLARGTPLGLRLHSDQSPELVAEDLRHFALVALEFPKFRDGRAYSYARLLRERYGYKGELRAVGDVLLEQVFFMLRTGFDAFDIEGDDPLGAYRTALADFTVWYQPTGDGRPTALQLRRRRAFNPQRAAQDS
jgi:uncharacterized protein (DUF934 family)